MCQTPSISWPRILGSEGRKKKTWFSVFQADQMCMKSRRMKPEIGWNRGWNPCDQMKLTSTLQLKARPRDVRMVTMDVRMVYHQHGTCEDQGMSGCRCSWRQFWATWRCIGGKGCQCVRMEKLRQERLTLQGINISHLGKRKIIFKMPFLGDMLVPWRVTQDSLSNDHVRMSDFGS